MPEPQLPTNRPAESVTHKAGRKTLNSRQKAPTLVDYRVADRSTAAELSTGGDITRNANGLSPATTSSAIRTVEDLPRAIRVKRFKIATVSGGPSSPYRQAGNRVSVVIPALNEADNLEHVLPRIPAWVHEVLLVDGGSTDETVAVACQLYPGVRILRQNGRGKGDALRQGFNAVTGDLIVMLDADGSTDPGEIPFFVGALMAGADFAKGTRYAQGGGSADSSPLHDFGNRTFTLMYRILFRNRCTDLCYGYNAFRAEILPLLDIDADGFEIETLINARVFRAGLKVVEVPSFEARRVHGDGKLRALPDGWRILVTLMRERLRSRESRRVRLHAPETA
jgi:hypothetical protein